MSLIHPSRALLGAAIAAALAIGSVSATDAVAAGQKKEAAAAPTKYPNATRISPSVKDARTTPANDKAIKALVKNYADATKRAEVIASVEAILANPKSNAYDKSFAAQIGGLVANQAGDNPKSLALLRQGLDAGGLDNDGHFDLMYNMAVVQTQMRDYAGAATTLTTFLSESKSTSAEAYHLLAQNQYEGGKYADAAKNAKVALDARPDAPEAWKQLYMLSLNKSGNAGGAIAEAKAMADAKPMDKVAQTNYAALLLQSNRSAEALAVLQKMRTNKLLTTDADYRNLIVMLSQQEGSDKAVIEVANEGLASKVLTQDQQVNLALAQAYYYSGQEGKAIEFFEKAAPESKNGETYLNLARIYWQRGENVQAKAAARKAQAKGVRDDKDIKRILALPDKGGSTVIIQKKK